MWSIAAGAGDENRRKGDSAATMEPYARAAARLTSCCRCRRPVIALYAIVVFVWRVKLLFYSDEVWVPTPFVSLDEDILL